MTRADEQSLSRQSRLGGILLVAVSVLAGLAIAELSIGYMVSLRDVGPSFTLHDPDLGKRLKPSFSTVRKTPEFTMRISTNAFGMRGPPVAELPKGAILFLGDSFTMGYGVSDGQEFPALVGAGLKRRLGEAAPPIINAGIGDNGNGRWIKQLRTLGDTVQPRLVVLQVMENDFHDNTVERYFELDQSDNLRELPIQPPGAGRRLQAFIEAVPGLASTNLVGLLRQVQWRGSAVAATQQVFVPDGKLRGEDRLTLKLIEAAARYCREKGWPVLAITASLRGEQSASVTRIFREHGVEVINVAPKSERPELYFKVDGHWNEAGHVHAADRLLAELERSLPARR